MGHTVNSIIINAPYDRIFDISNDITRWTELFGDEYKEAKIVKHENNKITFQLTDNEGNSWQSWRVLDKVNHFAVAHKIAPQFPFKYMRIIWLYEELPEGVLMTWIQDFTMDAKAKFNDAQVEGFINKHSQDNLKIFKSVIEREASK